MAVIIAAVAVLLLLEVSARILITCSRPARGTNKNFDSKYAIANCAPTNRPTVLCVGDSLISRGLYSELLSTRLAEAGINVMVLNLGSSATWPMDQLFLLQAAVDRGLKPRAVIYNVAPLLLKAKPEVFQHYSDMYSRSFFGDWFGDIPGLPGGIKEWLQQNSCLFSYRGYLKRQLTDVVKRVIAPEHYLPGPPQDRTFGETSPCGWSPAYGVATHQTPLAIHMLPSWVKHLHLSKSNPISSAVYSDGPIKRFCAERKIPLIFVWMPVHPRCGEMWQAVLGASEADFRQTFEALANSRETWFVDLHDIDHDRNHYLDLTHLNAIGAIASTDRFAEILKTPRFRRVLEGGSASQE